MNNRISWKGLELSIYLQGVYGNKIYNANNIDNTGMAAALNQTTAVLSRWTGAGTSNSMPRAVYGDPNQNCRVSDRFIEDGSYLRIKNISLSYALPSDLLRKISIESLRIILSCENLATFTKYSGFDPEVALNGIDSSRYPIAKTFSLGLNINLLKNGRLMKNYIITILAAALTLSSCKDFLDKSPKSQVDPDTDVTEDVAVALTNACYKGLQSSNLYNMRMWTLDILAGNSLVGAGGGTDGLETIQASDFITQSDNGMALYMWRSPWVGISQCNILLQSLEDADIDSSLKTRCLGEAYFLRAHYYYILVRLFGGVPIRKEPYDPDDSPAIARASLSENYEMIIDDCQKAISMLPTKYEYDAQNVGRACREAAQAMLADVYLTLAPGDASLYSQVVSL